MAAAFAAAIVGGLVLPGAVGAAPARARALASAQVGLGTPLSGSIAPAAPNSVLTSFMDRAGDDMDGHAPDLLGTQVWSDAAGLVTLRAEIPSVPALRPGVMWALFLDTDLNAATGNPYAAGADIAIAIDGDSQTVGLARWTGLRWDFDVPQASLKGAWSSGPLVSVDRAELGGTAHFRFWQGASTSDRTGATYTDVAPETGHWAHELTLAGPAIGPGVIPDVGAPTVRALASVGRRGHVARLRYAVSDDSGLTRERIQVYRGTRLVRAFRTDLMPSDRGVAYWAAWRVPARWEGRVRFCVRAWDAAGNASPRSCARLSLPR